jgi:molybdate transport system ATP-binding protein
VNGIRACFQLNLARFRLNLDLEIPGTGVTAIYGPSGAGKSTLLRCIAGLEHSPGGFLEVNGNRWQDGTRFTPPHRRSLGYVFQDANLFPHLSVRGNLEYGFRRLQPAQRRVEVERAVALLGLAPLLDRSPARLSGGERQRTAIARALLTSPDLLLFDEPLASLDRRSKDEILPYLEELHRELDIPVLYVSHAVDEVARLADYAVLLDEGRVLDAGEMAEMLTRLGFTATDDEAAMAVVETTVAGHDEAFHLTRLDFPGGRFYVSRRDLAPGQSVRVQVYARDVSITLRPPEHTSILNIFPARVAALADAGPGRVTVRLDAGGNPLLARVTRKSAAALGLQPGLDVYLQVKSVALTG